MPEYQPILILDPPHSTKRACLVPGCPCKDARIVSHRRAAFFASIARSLGETANRFIAPDPEWRLPVATA